MEAILYNQQGLESGKVKLSKEVFGKEVLQGLIHRLLVLQQANARVSGAHTKTRSDRNGSTRKLYKQKGTGQARAGDSRSPTRIGGGVAFGPRNNRNWTLMMNKKERRLALVSLLSSKAGAKKVAVIESFSEEAAKTKTMQDIVTNMGVKSAVFAVLPEDRNAFQGGRNIPNAKFIGASYLNPKDLLKFDTLVFTKASLEKVTAFYS
ncbi:MAG: large subunit ribosomal protein [Patescibacteria group bacterium]|nr:large subunit ribosomal protein [Patescibacteria group bacterium]